MSQDHLNDQYICPQYQLFKVQNKVLVVKPLCLHDYTFNLFFLSDVRITKKMIIFSKLGPFDPVE